MAQKVQANTSAELAAERPPTMGKLVVLGFAVHNGVGYLCKTAPSLCAQWGSIEDSVGALFLYGTLTWENAVRALCIGGEPELSTRHGAAASK